MFTQRRNIQNPTNMQRKKIGKKKQSTIKKEEENKRNET